MTETAVKSTIYFEEFSLDKMRRVLEKDGVCVNLNPKTLDLLVVLIENQGKVITKNELLDKVWADQFVEENNLTVHVAALRKALGEKKGDHRFIVTVPGRGYSFVADVEEEGEKGRKGEREKEDFDDNGQIANSKEQRVKNKEQNTLVGRAREILEIENLLRGDECRLLTLTGAGGSGKTSLARAVAANLSEDFSDGVFFSELAAVNDSELVAAEIAKTLGVEESGGKSLTRSLTDFLQKRRILLILDNFEQILSAAPLLQKLLNSTAFLKILVTSRHALNLNGEREIMVAPLALPPLENDLSAEKLNEYAAVELFTRQANSVRQNFLLNDENAKTVAEICRRLEGLPLAIELAAARIRLLSPQSILERLNNSLNLLTGGANDLPERQRTMRDAIKWSYELLNETEQSLFRRLSVFSGGFMVESAEKMSNIPPVISSPLDLLTSLIDNNLLTIKEQKDGEVRLQMLETVREFAVECLQEKEEAELLRQNHAQIFLDLAEEAEPHLSGERSVEWLKKLETEHKNFRASLRWSLNNEAETAARTAAALRYFWLDHSHLAEACNWFEQILERFDDQPSTIRFKLLNGFGLFMRNRGDYEKAQNIYEISRSESIKIKDWRQFAIATHGLAAIALGLADFQTAQRLSEEELSIFRQIGDDLGTASALGSLGDLALVQGNISSARPLLEESLSISVEIGNRHLTCINLVNLGTIAYGEKNYAEAQKHFADSLSLALEANNKSLASLSLDGFAALATVSGRPEQAVQISGAAEYVRESIGYELELTERRFRDAYLIPLRRAISEKSYNAALIKGRSLKLTEAVALAKTSFSDGQINEIIIETHKFERVIVEEEIEDVSDEFEVKQINSPNTKTGISGWLRKYFVFLVGAALAVIAGGYFWFGGMSGFAPAIPFANSSVKQLTTNGSVELAALSRDGKLFAYTTNDAGQRSLWLGYVDGGNHLLLRPAADVRYFDLDFSPDGTRLYFSIKDDKNPNGALYKIPVSGGAAEKVLNSIGNFTLAPDGGRIAFGKRDEDGETDSFFIADLNGAEQQKVASFPQSDSVNFNTLSWSPDSRRFAVSAGNVDFTNYQNLHIIEIPSGKIEQIKIEQLREISKIAWLKDNAGLIITAIKGDSWSSVPQYRVFHVELLEGKLRELTNDRSSYGLSLDLSENSSSFLTIEHRQLNNIWIAPSDNLSAARQITFSSFGKYDGLWGLDFTPDGKIIYTNSDTESQFISQMNADGGESKPLTAAGAIDSALNVSPDGRFIVFHSSRNGGFDVWRMESDGGNAQQLTFGKKNFQPFVSADNRWVYYKSYVNKKAELRRVSSDGGEPEILNESETSWLSFSPDGKYFAASYITDKPRLAIFSAQTNEAVRQFDLPKTATMSIGSRWTPDSKAVAFRDWYDGYWIQPVDGGEPQKLKGLPNEKFYNFAWSKDGKQFAFVRGQEIRDVVLFQRGE